MDNFSDDEVQEIIKTIKTLCSSLDWNLHLVSNEDNEGGISGIIIGNDVFIEEIGLAYMEGADPDKLH